MANEENTISSGLDEIKKLEEQLNSPVLNPINDPINKKRVEDEFARLSRDFFKAWGEDPHRWMLDAANTWEKDFISFIYGRYLIVNQLYRIFDDHGVPISHLAYHIGTSFASFLDELRKTTTKFDTEMIKKASLEFDKEVRRGFLERQQMLGHQELLKELYEQTVSDLTNEKNANANPSTTTTKDVE